MERVQIREEDIEEIRKYEQMEVLAKSEKLKVTKMKIIEEDLEEVDVLIDTHFFNQFSETKSSLFLN